MLREIGFFIVLLFPVIVVYLTGGLDKPQAANGSKKKKKSKKNKSKPKAVTTDKQVDENKQEEKVEEEKPKEEKVVQKVEQQEEKPMTKTALRKLKQEKKKAEKEALEAKNKLEEEAKKEQQDQDKKEEKEEKVKEIDEHMDTTAHYARVMRIQTEEEDDEWEAVPYEEGWSQVKARRPAPNNNSNSSSNVGSPVVGSSGYSSPSQMNPRLDRTAVKNAKKAQKRKEEKAANDALQAQRLRNHQKQLEKAKIDEFYSTGAGKNTPWGKKGSSKRPQATASVNEHGSLIWE